MAGLHQPLPVEPAVGDADAGVGPAVAHDSAQAAAQGEGLQRRGQRSGKTFRQAQSRAAVKLRFRQSVGVVVVHGHPAGVGLHQPLRGHGGVGLCKGLAHAHVGATVGHAGQAYFGHLPQRYRVTRGHRFCQPLAEHRMAALGAVARRTGAIHGAKGPCE